MYPMVRRISSGCVAASSPFTLARPDVGVNSPHSIQSCRFPAPFGPRIEDLALLHVERHVVLRHETSERLHEIINSTEFANAPLPPPRDRLDERAFERRRPGLRLHRSGRATDQLALVHQPHAIAPFGLVQIRRRHENRDPVS